MKKISVFLSLLFLALTGKSQSVTPVFKANLPAIAGESSGIVVKTRNKFWTHNDSGGANEIYSFDSTGVLTRTLVVRNASNSDWEDITTDNAGNFYVGDFGNNSNSRTDLVIYKIPSPDSVVGDSVDAAMIYFSYPDQDSFPPPASQFNFDLESFVHLDGHLYLFSKDESDPYSGFTKLYRLPDTAGTYVAELLDSFYTGSGPWFFTSVTSASMSADGKILALL